MQSSGMAGHGSAQARRSMDGDVHNIAIVMKGLLQPRLRRAGWVAEVSHCSSRGGMCAAAPSRRQRMNKVKAWQDTAFASDEISTRSRVHLQRNTFFPGTVSPLVPFKWLCPGSWCRKACQNAWRPASVSYPPGMAVVLWHSQEKVGRPMLISLRTFDLQDLGFQETFLVRATEDGFVGYSR